MKRNATLLSLVMAFSLSAWALPSMHRGVNFTKTQSAIQNDKAKIKKEELPEATRKTLNGDSYKGWTISSAYKLKNGEYEVKLTKGTETQTVTFDKEGKVK